MEALSSHRRMKAFRAADSFALEAYRVSSSFPSAAGHGIAGEIRRTAVRSGGAIVAASASEPGGDEEARHLESARRHLVEGRYYLYLARRLGLLDLKRYRALTLRQDAALREVDLVLRSAASAPPRAPP